MATLKLTIKLFFAVLLTTFPLACSEQETLTPEANQEVMETKTAPMEVVSLTETAPQPQASETPAQQAPQSPFLDKTSGPDCLGPDVHPIGQSIAETFPEITYQQVMVWFCNGAAFEDILLALETADLTDEQPEELLNLLAEGLTWEEIWQSLELLEDES